MNTFRANNEQPRLRLSGDSRSICFHLTTEALQWLSGTTRDDSNKPIANQSLFYDLLPENAIYGWSGRIIPPSATGTSRCFPILGDRIGCGLEYGAQARTQSAVDNGACRVDCRVIFADCFYCCNVLRLGLDG